jgi:MarR family transcriptional regulator, organic hydroperoxide resistance regulator
MNIRQGVMMTTGRVADLLGFQLSQVVRKLQKTYEAAFSPFGITPSQALLLDQLWQADGAPLKELGSRVHLDPTSVNWLVGQLEKAGLAERRRDPADKRVVRLWLTPAGDALRGQVVTEVRRLEMAVEGVLLRYISPAGLGALNEGLQALVAELPEGEDLLAAVAAEWDRRLERLRQLVEEENEGGGSKT